ncbi:hypothetical protein Taro_055350 [Colocasia esculenta]|uniref:Uncharacterized protein n=1 Tax=Colocasia esculenta TaxID=4460 RepID=A0A843XTD4_COLES|nr:hypothetical protein [Colocasia esculenta]
MTNEIYLLHLTKKAYRRQLRKTTVRGNHFLGSTQEVDVEARRSFGDDDSVGREQFNAMGL